MLKNRQNVAVVGSGGRESALAHRLHQDGWKVFVMPGNDGMAPWAQRVFVDETDFAGVVEQCKNHKINIVVVGPETPLVTGLADVLTEAGIKVFGPTRAATLLTEGSKAKAKTFMRRNSIPTPPFRVFGRHELVAAVGYIHFLTGKNKQVVVKVDGLAAGKGVFVCKNEEQAITAANRILGTNEFGEAGDRIIIEERIDGYELSIMAITDGTTVRLLPAAMDYKRLSVDPDSPMTGGMGAVCPVPDLDQKVFTQAREIIEQYIKALRDNDTPFTGCFFAGFMVTEKGPQLLEVNCRFGDPEIQAILAVVATPLTHLIQACVDETLAGTTITVRAGYAVCVVSASAGYPGTPEIEHKIIGLDGAKQYATVYHAATKLENGIWKTTGGRVLNFVAHALDIGVARTSAYRAAAAVTFVGRQVRSDIAASFVRPKH